MDSGFGLEDVEHRFDQALRAARVDDQSVSRLAVGRRDQDRADDSQHGEEANRPVRASIPATFPDDRALAITSGHTIGHG